MTGVPGFDDHLDNYGNPGIDAEALPVDRLRAAIGLLEQLRDDSTPGPWGVTDERGVEFDTGEGTALLITADPDPTIVATGFEESVHGDADTALIVVLHRSVDAQLAVLAYGVTLAGPVPEPVVALADAILGDQS